jgi:hypothetical protein
MVQAGGVATVEARGTGSLLATVRRKGEKKGYHPI